jgi:hypothetical protein
MKSWTTLLALALAAPLPGALASEEKDEGDPNVVVEPGLFEKMEFRLIGPFRGGRSTAVAGVRGAPFTFYMGTIRGGVWKTANAGTFWENVSDGDFGAASIGAVAVAESDPNVVLSWPGSHAPPRRRVRARARGSAAAFPAAADPGRDARECA